MTGTHCDLRMNRNLTVTFGTFLSRETNTFILRIQHDQSRKNKLIERNEAIRLELVKLEHDKFQLTHPSQWVF